MEWYRFHADGSLFYVTFSVVDWLPIFVSEAACKIVTESLNFCHRQKGLRINAYVIMPFSPPFQGGVGGGDFFVEFNPTQPPLGKGRSKLTHYQ